MKNFTDAELAAEGYREMALGFESMANIFKSQLLGDALGLHRVAFDEHRRRGAIWTRFATHPHAFGLL